MYLKYFKRTLDVTLSIIAIIVLSPIMIIAAILVRIELGSPVLFSQLRPGKNENIFRLYKFRTMTDEKDETGKLLPDTTRLTKFGRTLRASSVDELPELINILKGDMSIIGPRPLLVKYLPLYDEQQKRRHEVKPGLSGLAQINGRNLLTWEERFKLDVEYVDNVSLLLDLKIICMSIVKALQREGISAAGDATMPEFMGIQMDESNPCIDIINEAAATIDYEGTFDNVRFK